MSSLPDTISASKAQSMGWGTNSSSSSSSSSDASGGSLPDTISASDAAAMGWNTVSPTQDIANERQQRISQGLPVSVNPNKVQPTLAGNIVRGLVGGAESAGLSVLRGTGIGNAITGKNSYMQGLSTSSPYLGTVSDLGTNVQNKSNQLSQEVNSGQTTLPRALESSVANSALQTVNATAPFEGAAGLGELGVAGAKSLLGQGAKQAAEQIAQQVPKTLLQRGLNLAKTTAKTTGIGYGYDVAGNVANEQNNTAGSILHPHAGTVIGAVAPATIEATGAGIQGGLALGNKLGNKIEGVLNPELRTNTVIANRETELNKFNNYQSINKITQDAQSKGQNPIGMLARTNVLNGAVDKDGTIHTSGEGGAQEQYRNQYIAPIENVVRQNLVKEGKSLPIQDVKTAMVNAVNNSSLEGEALDAAHAKVEKEMNGLSRRADENGNISIVKLQDAKVNKYATIDYLNPAAKQADKTIAGTYKTLIENNTNSVDVKKLNNELGQHLQVQKLLETLDGKKVAGGKLGKYFAKGIGGLIGSHFGPVGTMAGSEIAGGIQGKILSSKFGSSLERPIDQSSEMQQAIQNLSKKASDTQQTNAIPNITNNAYNIPPSIQPNALDVNKVVPSSKSNISEQMSALKKGTAESSSQARFVSPR